MSKLEEIKEIIAKEKGYKDWEICINDQPNYMVEKLMDEVVMLYNNPDGKTVTEVRNSVDWFAKQMERKLKINDYKGGWKKCELQYLSMRLTQERKELTDAIASKDFQKIIDECADIANFAMMIADMFGPEFGK